MSKFRNQLEDYLKTIDVTAKRVLDIGGLSLPVNKRVKSWQVEDYVILDNDLEGGSTKHAYTEFDINMSLYEQSLDPSTLAADQLFCLEVFEYVWNPVVAMVNIKQLLKPGGIATISFPFVYPVHEPYQFDYLRYTPQGVTKLAYEVGLTIADVQGRYDHSGLLTQMYAADGMHPVKVRPINHALYGFVVRMSA